MRAPNPPTADCWAFLWPFLATTRARQRSAARRWARHILGPGSVHRPPWPSRGGDYAAPGPQDVPGQGPRNMYRSRRPVIRGASRWGASKDSPAQRATACYNLRCESAS
eukprot:3887036-Pyramimonas_sp.AAC.1